MSSVSKIVAFLALSAVFCLAAPPKLRVCADPNNLPFSNQKEQGFENRLAQMMAADLGMTLDYSWEPQRKDFLRKTLLAGSCDVVMGVPSGMTGIAETRPYFTSTYVFVSRTHPDHAVRSLDDPGLRNERIGVHLIGDDYAAVPPAQALAKRGIVRNVVGYNIYGNLDQPDQTGRLIAAVAKNDVDIAVVWGPIGGYFAKQSSVPLQVTPVCSRVPDKFTPMIFAVSVGVRPGDVELRRRLDSVLMQRSAEIHKLLESYGVPFATGTTVQTCD